MLYPVTVSNPRHDYYFGTPCAAVVVPSPPPAPDKFPGRRPPLQTPRARRTHRTFVSHTRSGTARRTRRYHCALGGSARRPSSTVVVAAVTAWRKPQGPNVSAPHLTPADTTGDCGLRWCPLGVSPRTHAQATNTREKKPRERSRTQWFAYAYS